MDTILAPLETVELSVELSVELTVTLTYFLFCLFFFEPKGDDAKSKMKGVKTMPNFNQIPSNDSNPKMESALGTNLKRNASSGADLHDTASSVKVCLCL